MRNLVINALRMTRKSVSLHSLFFADHTYDCISLSYVITMLTLGIHKFCFLIRYFFSRAIELIADTN